MGIKRPNISLGTKTLTVDESATFNENSVTEGDFRVESDNKTHMLFVDSSLDRVGVGTSSPGGALGIDGDIKLAPTAISTAHIDTTGSLDIRCTNNMKLGTNLADSIRIGRANTTATKVHIRSGSDADLVVANGKVGIGMEDPSDALEIDGDIQLSPTAITTAHVKTAGSLRVRATGNMYIGDDGVDSVRIGRANSTAAKIHIRSGADTDLVVTNSKVGIGTDDPKTALTVEGTVTLKEQADADADNAGFGQIWVNTATPNELYFTTDAGDDIQLTSGTGTTLSLANDSNNRVVTATGSGGINGEANLGFDGSTLAVTGALTTTTTATVGTDLTVTGGDISYGNAQDATLSVAAVAGTDTAGRNLTFSAGQGTGTGDGGSIIFQTASSVGAGSGSSANSLANVVTIDETGKITAPGGLVVDNITLDGVEIALSSGQFTLDIAGDISLDAGGGDIKYKTGGVEYLRITNSSNDVIFGNRVTDKDIIFKEDGGTEVFRMDSSDECLLVTSGDLKFGNTNHAHITVSPVSGTDTAGKDLVIQSGQGTGTGAGGGMQFQVADGGGSTGTSVNSWVTALTIADDKNITCAADVAVGDDLSLTSDSSVLNMGAGNDFTITHDGTTGATLAGNPITITSGGACTWSASAGNVTIDSAAAGVIIDGHTGVTVQSTDSGNITLDSVADIKLDAAGNDIKCLAGPSDEFLRFSHSSGDALIRSMLSDKDLVFKGSDAGSTITALTLDMSAGGAAIFRDMVTVGTDLNVDGGDIVYGNGQDATMSITATAHDTAGKPLAVSAGNTTAGTTNNIAGGALTLNGGQGKGSGAGGEIIFQTAPAAGSGSSMNNLVERMRVVEQGQLKMKESAGHPGTASGYGWIYSANDSGTTEMYVKDGAGNQTKISPHDEEGEWEFFSRNTATGKTVKIKMEKLLKRLNDQFGEAGWYEETWDE